MKRGREKATNGKSDMWWPYIYDAKVVFSFYSCVHSFLEDTSQKESPQESGKSLSFEAESSFHLASALYIHKDH